MMLALTNIRRVTATIGRCDHLWMRLVVADHVSAIGAKQTCSMHWRLSAFGGKADIDRPLITNLDLKVNGLDAVVLEELRVK